MSQIKREYLSFEDASSIEQNSKNYTDEQIANLLNNSTDAVDSIYELNAAMETNADAIAALVEISGSKVDKVNGKQLSTEDFTTDLKNKLNGIAAGANAYSLPVATSSVLEGVKTGSNITNTGGTISLTSANVTNALGFTPSASHSHNYLPSAGGTLTGGLTIKMATPILDFNYGSAGSYTSRIQSPASGIVAIGGTGKGSVRINHTDGNVSPATTGAFSLGTTDLRWHKVYLRNSPDVSSLAELKTGIQPFKNALIEVDNTDVYQYLYKDNIERDGADTLHTGFIIGKDYKCSKFLLGENSQSIDLYSAIGVTFGAVKELYELVKQQQEKIEKLKGENK